MNFAIKVVLAHLKLKQKFELGVISILKEIIINTGNKILPLDMIEANPSTPGEKITKWEMIKKWNNDPSTSDWAKYDEISPKHFKPSEDKEIYNVIGEFRKDTTSPRLIEVMLWTSTDVNKFIGENTWRRGTSNLEVNKGNYGT
jgi:hypothetical protein